jgi:hypothetical protein
MMVIRMKTLFDQEARGGLMARLERVTAESRPRWGKMNAEQMLAHLVEAMRMGLGEVQTRPKKMVTRFPPFRQLFVYWLPWPKGAPTARELLPSDRREIDVSRREIARLANAIADRVTATEWPDHPVFGKLSRRGWGVVGWRHIDHHLRQFGL